jgi:hypothetical protein
MMSPQERAEVSKRIEAVRQAAEAIRADRASAVIEPLPPTPGRKGKKPMQQPDYGPVVRLKRGEVEKTQGPDPESPKDDIRRAKLVVAYEVLWRAKAIDDAQREACDRYLMDAEAAEGAKDAQGNAVGRLEPWRKGHPPERQLQALVSLRNARAALGPNGRALCDLLMLENLSVRKIAERRGERQEVTMGQLLASLTRLAEHWNMSA